MPQKQADLQRSANGTQEAEYFRLTTDEVYQSLKTCADGLSPEDAEARVLKYGKNQIREIKGKPLIVRFLANFTHLMAICLGGRYSCHHLRRCPNLLSPFGWSMSSTGHSASGRNSGLKKPLRLLKS